MCAALRDLAHQHQRYAHEHMTDHLRDRGALGLGKGVKLLGKLARDVALERHPVADPKAVEHGKQQQRIVDRLAEPFRLLDQPACLLERRFGRRRGMALRVDQCIGKIDLQLDALAAKRRRCWHRRDQVERARKLLRRLLERRARERAPSGRAPQHGGFFDQPRFAAVARQELRPALDHVGELALRRLGDARVQRTSRLAQQRAIGRVLHQGMIE